MIRCLFFGLLNLNKMYSYATSFCLPVFSVLPQFKLGSPHSAVKQPFAVCWIEIALGIPLLTFMTNNLDDR